MDGYAVRLRDVQGANRDNPAVLNVRGDLPAGRVFQGELGAREAIRIMTGAPLPPGADTVVQVEDTAPAGAQVRILTAPGRGKNIRQSGEDVKAGEVVLAEGAVLQPALRLRFMLFSGTATSITV
jgi:molybdopterin molybdotransferase